MKVRLPFYAAMNLDIAKSLLRERGLDEHVIKLVLEKIEAGDYRIV